VKAEKAWKKKAAKAAAAAIRTDAPTTVEEVTTDKDAFARFKRRVARHVKESATPHPGYVRAAEAIAKLEAAAPKGRAASVHPLRLNVNALMKKEPEWVAEVTASEDEKAKKALSTKASEEPTPSTVARDEAEAKEREAKIKTARRKAENELEQAGLDKELAVSERPVDAGETTKNVVAAIERRAKIIVNIDKLLKPRGGVKSLDRPSLEAMIDVYDKSRATTDDAVKAVATNTVPETAEEAVARAESEVDQVNDDDDVAAVAEIMLAPEPPVTRQVAPPQNLATLVTGYGDTKGKFETRHEKEADDQDPRPHPEARCRRQLHGAEVRANRRGAGHLDREKHAVRQRVRPPRTRAGARVPRTDQAPRHQGDPGRSGADRQRRAGS
jgi:hypothetical protein